MIEGSSKLEMSAIKLRTVAAALLLAFIIVSMTASFDVSVASSSSITTAPVYIHFKPKTITISCTNCDIKITAIAKNKGNFSATATSCEFWVDGVKQKGCPLPSSDFPFTLAGGAKVTVSWSQHIGNLPTGTYKWKIIFLGTYNGVSAKSHAGKFTLIEKA
jgi:hypothetical protein